MIYTNFVELDCLMFLAKFQYQIIGFLVLEKKIFKDFFYLWPWRPSWSCDLDHLYKFPFPLPKDDPYKVLRMLHIKFGFDWPSGLRGE